MTRIMFVLIADPLIHFLSDQDYNVIFTMVLETHLSFDSFFDESRKILGGNLD
jgi:hypothetical protein